jgi:hypothetical protein
MDRGAELQDLLLHAVQGAVPDSVLSDAIDARIAITQYAWTGIPWYLATCAEHIARVFIQGARFAGAMQFIDHRWVTEFAQEHVSRAKLLQEDLEDRLRLQVAPVLAEYSSERDDVTSFAFNAVTRPLLGSENPGHVALKKTGFACHGLAAIYRQTVGEFYSDLRFSPPHGFPAPIDGEYSMERPETWMHRLFAQEFSAAAQVPFSEATMSEEWAQAVDWEGTELASILGKVDFSPDEIGRASTRICGYLVSLSGAFVLLQNAASKTMVTANHALRGVLVGAALAVNPDWGFKALEVIRTLPE